MHHCIGNRDLAIPTRTACTLHDRASAPRRVTDPAAKIQSIRLSARKSHARYWPHPSIVRSNTASRIASSRDSRRESWCLAPSRRAIPHRSTVNSPSERSICYPSARYFVRYLSERLFVIRSSEYTSVHIICIYSSCLNKLYYLFTRNLFYPCGLSFTCHHKPTSYLFVREDGLWHLNR